MHANLFMCIALRFCAAAAEFERELAVRSSSLVNTHAATGSEGFLYFPKSRTNTAVPVRTVRTELFTCLDKQSVIGTDVDRRIGIGYMTWPESFVRIHRNAFAYCAHGG